jgi:hypothetical protein
MKRPACGTCKWGEIDTEFVMRCHLNPPQIIKIKIESEGGDVAMTIFPHVRLYDFCSRWEMNPDATPPANF